MKKLLLALLVGGTALTGFAQPENAGNWSVGVGVTSLGGGLTLGGYINKHLNDRWQVGVMPFARFYKFNSDFTNTRATTLGLNLNGRYYLVKWQLFLPYAYAYGGYGETYATFEHPSSVDKSTDRFFNTSVGLGTQILLGRGWSVDANIGYFGYFGVNETGSITSYIYSFGMFKRIGKGKK